MQILITHGSLARTSVLRLTRLEAMLAAVGVGVILLALAGVAYHFIVLPLMREAAPRLGPAARLSAADGAGARDRFLRANLDAMAQRVGEMQAKLVRLEVMGERVFGLAGIKLEDPKPASKAPGGEGGPFIAAAPSLERLQGIVDRLDQAADRSIDLFTVAESHLFERRLQALMVPDSRPVDGRVGSGFGIRTDPFTGHAALHSGIDFPADVGTAIKAAAGGVVRHVQAHPAYGNMLEIDHGNGLVTRYAHASRIRAKAGDIIRRGQLVADIGSTGRSTGPHLHFEVLLDGVPQNPARFLARGPGGSRALASLAEARTRH